MINRFTRTAIMIAAFVVILLPMSAGATGEGTQADDGEVQVLTLQDCIEAGLEQNVSLRRSLIGVEISYLGHVSSLAVYDPGFDLNFSTQQTEGSGDTGGTDAKYDFGMSYVQPTWLGGRWSISLDQSRSDGSSLVGDTYTGFTSYSSQLGVAYSMPILEGYGERMNRVGVQRADLGIMRSETGISELERNLRYSIIQSYISVVLAGMQIDVARASLGTAENLVSEVQARIDVGQLAPYELLSAQAGLAERQENIIRAENTYNAALDSLKELIGLPLGEEIEVDMGILAPLYLELETEDLYMTAQRNRPDYRDIDLRIQQAQLDQLLAEDRRQSSLNWNTVFGLAGQDDDYGSSVGNMDRFTWYTGIEYSLPLGGNRAAVADVTSSRLALEQLDLEKLDYLRNLELEIRTAVDNFNTAMLRVDVTSQGLIVQETKMQNELLRLELGLITSRDLLEFDLDLVNARLSYDNALADLFVSLARIELITSQEMIEDAVVLTEIAMEPEVVAE